MLADAATHPTAPTKAAAPTPTPAAAPDRPRWRLAKRVLTGAFFAAVAYLIFQYAREVKWSDVLRALQTTPMATLAGAAALAAASHLVYSTYDVIGREVVGHSLRRAQVMVVGFVSYAFNLNLGSLVGGVALRYRLYSRLGLQAPVITQVLGLSLLTNWLGYLFVAGAVFLLRPLELPPDWKLGSEGLRIVGALALAAGVAYLWMCFSTRRGAGKNGQRVWHVRGHELHLPSGRVALVQLGLSALNWSLIAGVVWLLLRGRVDYFSVLSVALVAAVAGVLTHVPAGLGVLEAVFVALLSHRVAQPELLAALLTYRALYYLLPLVLAVPAFMAIDARARGMGTDMGTRLAKTGATESPSRRDDRLERTHQ